jgi:hypothetical protein
MKELEKFNTEDCILGCILKNVNHFRNLFPKALFVYTFLDIIDVKKYSKSKLSM